MIATEPRSSVLIFCEGFRKGGQRCKIILGVIENGVVNVKHVGRVIEDVRGPIRCEMCGWIWQRPGTGR